MKRPPAKIVRRGFPVALGRAFLVTWPVLSAILVIQSLRDRHLSNAKGQKSKFLILLARGGSG
jgi:hypothetical protein